MSARRVRARRLFSYGAAVLLGLAGVGPVHAEDAYFLLIFGAQRIPNNPDYTHSFAAFVRASWEGPAGAAPRLEVHTISWLPRSLRIRALALAPEPGANWDLHPTLRYALGEGERVSLWGPFQIQPDLYARAVNQVRLLDSGQVAYKANDIGYPTDRVSNCIHAIMGVADGHRAHVAIPGWGETGSYFLVRDLSSFMVDPGRVHPWVVSALGLGAYPIIYRNPKEAPYSGMVQGTLHRVLGGERHLQVNYGPPVIESAPR
jgi:hypothetical protein